MMDWSRALSCLEALGATGSEMDLSTRATCLVMLLMKKMSSTSSTSIIGAIWNSGSSPSPVPPPAMMVWGRGSGRRRGGGGFAAGHGRDKGVGLEAHALQVFVGQVVEDRVDLHLQVAEPGGDAVAHDVVEGERGDGDDEAAAGADEHVTDGFREF